MGEPLVPTAPSSPGFGGHRRGRVWRFWGETDGVGVAIATFRVLADVATTAARFVDIFVLVYILLIFAYVLTSWVRMPYSLSWLQRFLNDVCEPYLRIFRRLLPSLGPLDVSPIVGVVVLVALDQVVTRLID